MSGCSQQGTLGLQQAEPLEGFLTAGAQENLDSPFIFLDIFC